MEEPGRLFRRYLYATGAVAIALGLRMLLLRWTGVGASFLLFFFVVLLSSFRWGVGPGLLAGFLSTLIGGSLFVYQARFTLAQTLVQSFMFFCEAVTMCVLASRFSRAKRRAELNEQVLRKTSAERRIFQAVLENSSDFVGLADERGNPTWVNPAGRRMVGLDPDFPIETTKIPEYYPPEQRAFAADVILKSTHSSPVRGTV